MKHCAVILSVLNKKQTFSITPEHPPAESVSCSCTAVKGARIIESLRLEKTSEITEPNN